MYKNESTSSMEIFSRRKRASLVWHQNFIGADVLLGTRLV